MRVQHPAPLFRHRQLACLVSTRHAGSPTDASRACSAPMCLFSTRARPAPGRRVQQSVCLLSTRHDGSPPDALRACPAPGGGCAVLSTYSAADRRFQCTSHKGVIKTSRPLIKTMVFRAGSPGFVTSSPIHKNPAGISKVHVLMTREGGGRYIALRNHRCCYCRGWCKRNE